MNSMLYFSSYIIHIGMVLHLCLTAFNSLTYVFIYIFIIDTSCLNLGSVISIEIILFIARFNV